MYNEGRVGESTYFSTETSGFIRVSRSRKAKGNKTQRNTNRDSHYQPFKYTDHALVVYIEKKGSVHFTHFSESTFSSTKAAHQSSGGQTAPQTSRASRLTPGVIINFRCCVLFTANTFMGAWATHGTYSVVKGLVLKFSTADNRT